MFLTRFQFLLLGVMYQCEMILWDNVIWFLGGYASFLCIMCDDSMGNVIWFLIFLCCIYVFEVFDTDDIGIFNGETILFPFHV